MECIEQAREWRFPDRVKLPLALDGAALEADLRRIEARDWTRHVVRQNYRGDWDVLPLRHAAGETHPIRQAMPVPGAIAHVDSPLLAGASYIGSVLTRLRCSLRNVRLMRLTAGSAILEHCDPGMNAESGLVRLHAPIRTGGRVSFRVNGTPVVMAPGELWYLRLSDPHAVDNDDAVDRVHLVIDAEVNDWLEAMLAAAR
jgi:hypothetical protein